MVEAARYDGEGYTSLGEEELKALRSAVTLKGTVGDCSDEDTGYLVELGIPRTWLPDMGSDLRCHVVLKNQEKDGLIIDDKLDGVYSNDPSGWMPLVLEP